MEYKVGDIVRDTDGDFLEIKGIELSYYVTTVLTCREYPEEVGLTYSISKDKFIRYYVKHITSLERILWDLD